MIFFFNSSPEPEDCSLALLLNVASCMEGCGSWICASMPFEHTSAIILKLNLLREKNRKEYGQRAKYLKWTFIVEVGLVAHWGEGVKKGG